MFKNLNRRWFWILDAVLFIGFLLSFWLDFTGLELHQWLGVILALAICYHFLTHLEWLAAVLRRFFKRTSSRARLNLSVDLLILTGMILILLSGLAVTTWFDFIWEPSGFLVTLHIAASISTLALLVVKIGLHWRWIVHTLRSALLPQWSLAWQTPALQTTAQSSSAGRRDFLVLMGITGAAALLSIVKPFETLSEEKIPTRVSQT